MSGDKRTTGYEEEGETIVAASSKLGVSRPRLGDLRTLMDEGTDGTVKDQPQEARSARERVREKRMEEVGSYVGVCFGPS